MRRELSAPIFALVGVECDRAREAISALIDGEDPGLPGEVLEAHLADCAACQSWRQAAHEVTRRARIGGRFLDHDLTAAVLAAVPATPPARRQPVTQRAGLAVVAVAQLAITIPSLILGHDHAAGVHAAHELGSFDLALAIAFAVGAIRPALSAGLAWPCGVAAAGLAGTAIVDLVGGQTLGADEAQHLVAVCGAVLLFWQARTVGGRTAAAAADAPGIGIPGTPARTAGRRRPLREPDDPGSPVGEPASPRDGDRARRTRHGGGSEAVA
jgi:predicted anti-sigma-YlaC factor YlaD